MNAEAWAACREEINEAALDAEYIYGFLRYVPEDEALDYLRFMAGRAHTDDSGDVRRERHPAGSHPAGTDRDRLAQHPQRQLGLHGMASRSRTARRYRRSQPQGSAPGACG